jgi:S-formylglutathione hydrolase FrmB
MRYYLSKVSAMIFLVAIASGTALTDGRVECATVKSRILGRVVRYCALLPAGYDTEKTRRYPVLYYLHGLGDNEQSLVNGGGWNIVEQLRASSRIGDFLIVTPDGDRSFYINSHPTPGAPAGQVRYEDFFIQEFIPDIEQRYRVQAGRAGRAVAGISMGGYGALRFAFKYPQMFAAVSAHMPALYETVPPFLRAAGTMPGMRMARLDMGSVFGSPFDEKFWEQNSPFTLARQNATRLAPTHSKPGRAAGGAKPLKIYFDCGDEDGYGFDAGARALDALLRAHGVPHEFHIYPGGHNWTYVIEHFGEAISFQARALGAGKP